MRFVDEEPDKRKNDWKLNDRWAWFIGDNRQSLKLTTKPEPYTLDRTLRWVQRQVAPTLKMLKKIDKGNGTDYMETIEQQAKLTEKHEMILLQFGNSNAEEIGADRVEALVSASPEDEDGKTREEVVKTEIEDNDNNNLTIPQVVNRLGMVFFLLFFNLGITIFVFLLTGMMLFSQILFIIFAMFLPISFLLSMIPSYESMAKQAIVRVFNTIMTRAGITLIVTVAFSISSMFYNISTDYPFFMVAFLQIVCFAGIYMKLGDLMSMFSLNANDSQSMGRRIFRRPYLFMRHGARRMEHRIASFVILVLVFLFWLKNRVQEVGIFLSLGVPKFRIIGQIWSEAIMIAVLSLMLSFAVAPAVSKVTANYLVSQQVQQMQEEEKNNEGKVSTEYVAPKQDVQNISVEVTPEMYLLDGVSVLVLITASVLVSGIVILKRNPKDILSEMS